MDASRLARALWGGGYAPENDAIAYGRNVDRQAARSELLDALAGTWPAQMAKSAVGAAALPGDVYAGRVDPTSQQGIERAADLAGFVMGGSFAAPRPAGSIGMGGMPEKPGIRAYHGSPHDFDKFDMSKIGTGEGAQAYGHGLYFAEKEGTAKSYRDALAAKPLDTVNNAIKAAAAFSGDALDVAKMRDWLVREGFPRENITPDIVDLSIRAARGQMPDGTVTDDALRAYRALEPVLGGGKGRMYEVNIKANPDDFLDWDKPIAMNHPMRERVAELGMQGSGALNAADRNMAKDAFLAARNENMTGSGLYNSLTRSLEANRDALKGKFGEEALFSSPTELARRDLLERGIPGIKYLDKGSRAAGDGSRNYVVFDDKLIEILRKYGLTGLLGLGAVGGAYQNQTNEGGT